MRVAEPLRCSAVIAVGNGGAVVASPGWLGGVGFWGIAGDSKRSGELTHVGAAAHRGAHQEKGGSGRRLGWGGAV